jgi:ADP-heptose:LPS heptosyltransferase
VATRAAGLNGLAEDAALIRRLRRQRFDLAIDFHGGPRASILTWLSGARERIGYDVAGRGWMYTQRVERPRALRARHSVLNQWDLLTVLDIEPPPPGAMPVEMPVDATAARAVQHRLEAAGAAADDRLIVLHVSAGNPFRRWPIASFAAVASDLVLGDRRHRVVVTSGPSEHDAANRVIAEARAALPEPERPRVLSCGEFSLVELRALVEYAALYIGGDSGPLHIAATSRVPIVGLYGPTLPARSAPWRAEEWPTESVQIEGLACRPCDQRTCEPGDFRCLGWIQPRQVVEAANRALARLKS